MSAFHEILAEERRFCEQRNKHQQSSTVEIVCVSLSSKSMDEDDDDACVYSDATSVSSVTLASSFDDDDIVTIHDQTNCITDDPVMRDNQQGANAAVVSPTSTHKLSSDVALQETAERWNDQGDTFREAGSYPQAMSAYQQALHCGVGVQLARAYAGLGSVYIVLGDVNAAVEYRNLADIALTKADESARSVLTILRAERSMRSFAEDELNDLFLRVTNLE